LQLKRSELIDNLARNHHQSIKTLFAALGELLSHAALAARKAD
jgi:hypothetical protein